MVIAIHGECFDSQCIILLSELLCGSLRVLLVRVMQLISEVNVENLQLKDTLLRRQDKIDELQSEVEALSQVISSQMFKHDQTYSDCIYIQMFAAVIITFI